jgi:hypothetical protein
MSEFERIELEMRFALFGYVIPDSVMEQDEAEAIQWNVPE